MHSAVPVNIDAKLYFIIPICLLIAPIKIFLSWIFAALIHEMGHILVLIILKVNILSITIGSFGASIRTENTAYWKELLCTMAGPLAGSILLLFARPQPLIALCAGLQTLFNLLPVPGLDGARVIRCFYCVVTSAVHKLIKKDKKTLQTSATNSTIDPTEQKRY